MITDEERHEAAEGLRNLSDGNRVRYKEEFYELLDETVMEPDTGYHEMNDVFERIADLIDRPTCENVYPNIPGNCDNGFECSVCGVTVEDCEGYYVYGTWNYCPKCRRKVVKGGH